jgi:hypothetical protein
MREYRGQNTLELLILFASVLLILAVVAVSIPSNAIASLNLEQMQQAQQTVDEIADTVDLVYLEGEGSQKRIWIRIPSGWDRTSSFIGARSGETNWTKRKLININYKIMGDIFAKTKAPVCGEWPAMDGRTRITIAYNASDTPHVSINGEC